MRSQIEVVCTSPQKVRTIRFVYHFVGPSTVSNEDRHRAAMRAVLKCGRYLKQGWDVRTVLP